MDGKITQRGEFGNQSAESDVRTYYQLPASWQSPCMTRRTKTTLIDREGRSVPGLAEAEEQTSKP